MFRFVLLLLLGLVPLGVAFGQNMILVVPEGLTETEVGEHQEALRLLSKMIDKPKRFVDTTQVPTGFIWATANIC